MDHAPISPRVSSVGRSFSDGTVGSGNSLSGPSLSCGHLVVNQSRKLRLVPLGRDSEAPGARHYGRCDNAEDGEQ